ncbi:MAG: putative hydro-lyase [Lachnospiraceae bacterium]|nr:putative hydro-lyase [Lachnospiraceae bacterium]
MKHEDYTNMAPGEVRARIRDGFITGQTSGMCAGYAQANLVVLPGNLAYDFLLFAQRNPRSCPLLEVTDTGSRHLHEIADGADLAREIPRYRIYRNGVLTEERTDVSDLWQDDFVSFLIGCSFSFEAELLDTNVPVRHIEENRNVPMYRTSIPCTPAGVFHGNMVVSMRPIPYELVPRAVQVTGALPRVHGAPIHIGSPETIGITHLEQPDFGEMVTIREGEVPVFWPCGVTPQNVVMESKPSLAITHAPGHMFITDIRNTELKY